MKNFSEACWVAVSAYSGALCVSLALFLHDPNPHPGEGPHWNLLFQCLGPTIGSFGLILVVAVQMYRRRISVLSGFGAIVLVGGVSALCLVLAMPIMIHI